MGAGRDAIRSLEATLRAVGTNAQYTRAKGGGGFPVRLLLSHVTPRDEALVNAYGIDAVTLTLPDMSAFKSHPPEKFDAVKFADGTVYVFNAVHPVQLDDTRVGWTCYSKGKGA